jgi:tetratricopeptide (TPR) repeat protein
MASRPPEALAALSDEERAIEAGGVRRKAEVLLERGDHVGAEKLATQAHELDRTNADGLALLGWLRSMKPGTTSVTDGLKLVDESVRRNPGSDRALFYRGSLLKRAGRADEALRDFRKAAELNPKNIDAVREVRLHMIRAGGTEKAGTKRLIGKLFGK